MYDLNIKNKKQTPLVVAPLGCCTSSRAIGSPVPRSYASEAERATRFATFAENFAKIEAHNAEGAPANCASRSQRIARLLRC